MQRVRRITRFCYTTLILSNSDTIIRICCYIIAESVAKQTLITQNKPQILILLACRYYWYEKNLICSIFSSQINISVLKLAEKFSSMYFWSRVRPASQTFYQNLRFTSAVYAWGYSRIAWRNEKHNKKRLLVFVQGNYLSYIWFTYDSLSFK